MTIVGHRLNVMMLCDIRPPQTPQRDMCCVLMMQPCEMDLGGGESSPGATDWLLKSLR